MTLVGFLSKQIYMYIYIYIHLKKQIFFKFNKGLMEGLYYRRKKGGLTTTTTIDASLTLPLFFSKEYPQITLIL